jgi:hypothetical protein
LVNAYWFTRVIKNHATGTRCTLVNCCYILCHFLTPLLGNRGWAVQTLPTQFD